MTDNTPSVDIGSLRHQRSGLDDRISSPEKRAEWENQMKSLQNNEQTQQDQGSVQGLTKNLVTPGRNVVYIENNRARPQHFKDHNGNPLVIDGQLSSSEAGPFLAISEDVLNELYQIHHLFERKIKGTNKFVFEKLNKEKFRERYSTYRKRAAILEAQWRENESNSSRHADGTVDEWDRAKDDFKINYNVTRG